MNYLSIDTSSKLCSTTFFYKSKYYVEEQEKLFRKLSHLSDSDKDAINKSLHQIVNKLLHDPIITLRDEVKRDDSSRLVKVFKDLFNSNSWLMIISVTLVIVFCSPNSDLIVSSIKKGEN